MRAFVGLALVTLWATAPLLRAATYTFVDLHTPGASVEVVSNVGPAGAVGYRPSTGINGEIPTVWTPAEARSLMWTSDYGAALVGSDGSRQVGLLRYKLTGYRAAIWNPDGSILDIHPSGYTRSVANDILGNRVVGQVTGTAAGHAFLWQLATGQTTDLHPAGWQSSDARAIDGASEVGFGVNAEGSEHAILWQDSSGFIDLHPANFVKSRGVAAAGNQQAGDATAADGLRHAMLWNGSAESAIDLTPAGFNSSAVTGMDDQYQYGFAGTLSEPIRWHGASDDYLNLKQFMPTGYIAAVASGADADGNIYGVAITASNEMHAVVWAIPEPTSGAVAGIVFIANALALRHRRRYTLSHD